MEGQECLIVIDSIVGWSLSDFPHDERPPTLPRFRSILLDPLSCLDKEDLPAQINPQKMAYLANNLNRVVGLFQGRAGIM
jgi:hypothetical protein